MKTYMKRIAMLFVAVIMVTGCEEDLVIYDTENGEAFAGFQSNSPPDLIFNPVEDTENRYTISTSTVSSSDRTVSVTVDPSSTLDPSFYSIENLNPVIPAGEFATDIVITTLATDTFPEDGSVLVLNLESVEGSEIRSFNVDSQTIGFTVECPSVDLESIPGTYAVTEDEFGFVIGEEFEIVAGPEENQFTMMNLSGHSNPDADGEQNYDVVFTIDPNSGNVTVSRQDAWHYDTFGGTPDYGVGRVQGSGLALTCIGQINLELTHTVAAGSFGTYALQVTKQ